MSAVLYPQVTPIEWAKQWDCPVLDLPCKHCGQTMYVDKPFISADFVGFERTECPHCSKEHKCCSAVIRNPGPEWGISLRHK